MRILIKRGNERNYQKLRRTRAKIGNQSETKRSDEWINIKRGNDGKKYWKVLKILYKPIELKRELNNLR